MNTQTQRPQPQTGSATFRSHEAREHHGAGSGAGQSKIEFYSRRSEADTHDDGLVHEHFWAMSSTVR